MDYIHTVGMLSLYEGYIIKVYDTKGTILWDARTHDMALCDRVMEDISERMRIKYPQIDGEFKVNTYYLTQSGIPIGTVDISYFGPFFLSENEFRFLDSLNRVLLGIGFASLVLSIFIGSVISKRISEPILKTVAATGMIAEGNYGTRLGETSDTRELKALIASVNHLASSLETLEKLRNQLTEDVAHELRTPITILQAHIEAMAEGLWEPTSERLQGCYEETIRISNLIGDLEKLTKIESENLKLNITSFLIQEEIHKVVLSLNQNRESKQIGILVQGQEFNIMADRDRIHQVLVNLISNAIKYSKAGGCILVETFEKEDTCGFHIKDQGIGIPIEEQPFIFERFYRSDKSRNRLTGGTGIGLTIVKAIVEAHGGRITVESEVNNGSVFTVFLPKERRK